VALPQEGRGEHWRAGGSLRSTPATQESWQTKPGDRFWFCGRKSHRVITASGTLFTIPCEAIFNQHPRVYRSALVGVGNAPDQRPVIIVEPWPERRPKSRFDQQGLLADLADLAQQHERTRSIRDFFILDSMPVDIRHNAKIFREKLAAWVASKLPIPAAD
jgi:acyl-coenzyme A synthetase/AMP-(fatty) acid ligase